jgi:hypothetical protein
MAVEISFISVYLVSGVTSDRKMRPDGSIIAFIACAFRMRRRATGRARTNLVAAITPAVYAIAEPNGSGGVVGNLGLAIENEEMAILTCPDCGVNVQPEDLICFRCGANLPHTPYADDDIPSPTVSQQYLRPGDGRTVCPNCGAMAQDPADVVCTQCRQPLPGTGARRRISPVVLRISFPTGNVDVPAGTSVILGRDPAQSLVAAAFGQYDNVSRRHATSWSMTGSAPIRDGGSTNGTFVNGDRVPRAGGPALRRRQTGLPRTSPATCHFPGE